MSAHSTDAAAPSGRLILDLHDLSEDGKDFHGELAGDIFQLEPGGPHPVPPLRYRLHVTELEGGLALVTGEVSADFTFECVRCLEPFTDRLTLPDWAVELEWNPANSRSLDLTDQVREDILLALPGYPRCEEGRLHPRACPAAQRFSSASDYTPLPPEEGASARRSEQWGALDQLNLSAPKAAGNTHKHP